MGKVLFAILFFLCSLGLYAQEGKITVLSKTEKNPIVYANVTLKTSSETKSYSSNNKGEINYYFEIGAEKLDVIVSYIGYKNYQGTIVAGESVTIYLEKSKVNLGPVVVTAEYAPTHPDKSIHKVKIITQEQIQSQGAVTLRDILTNEVALRINQDNVLGSSANMQGISGQNIKVLIDGVPVIGRLDGNIDLSQISLNNAERIEIVEGPLAVDYGTDALAGTINIITKKDLTHNYEGLANVYYESVGQYNIDGRLSWKKNQNSFALSGGRNYFDGWSPQDDYSLHLKPNLADSTRFKQWNPKEQLFVKGQFIRKIKRLNFIIQSALFDETIINRGMPRTPYFETAFDDHYHTQRWDKSISFGGALNDYRNLRFTVSNNNYKRIKNTYFKDLTTLSQDLTANDGDQDTTRFDLWFSRGSFSTSKDSSKFNCQLGYELSIETGYGLRIEENEKSIQNYALFMSSEYKPTQDLTFKLGLRTGYNTNYKHPLIPSLNLRYQLKKTTIRASVARGFRAPSIKELYFNFVDINHNVVGNQDLNAETSTNYQVTVSRKQLKEELLIRTELSVFYNTIENMITLAQANPAEFSYFNIDRFKTHGLKFNGSIEYKKLNVNIGGAYIGRYNSISDSFDVKPFAYSPELNSSLSYAFEEQKATLNLFYKYTGELPGFFLDDVNEVQQSSIDAYQNLDASVTKKFSKVNIEWTLGMKNIFDVTNVNSSLTTGSIHTSSSSSVPLSWGRTFFTSVKYYLNYDKK